MNKRFGVIAILVVLVLVVNFSSANWFSDVWDTITGNTITGNAIITDLSYYGFDGYFDGTDGEYFYGWACDKNNPNDELIIHFYFDSKAYAGGAKLATVANLHGESAIGNRCGGNSNHRFSVEIPDSLRDNGRHDIYAYAISSRKDKSFLLPPDTPVRQYFYSCSNEISSSGNALSDKNLSIMTYNVVGEDIGRRGVGIYWLNYNLVIDKIVNLSILENVDIVTLQAVFRGTDKLTNKYVDTYDLFVQKFKDAGYIYKTSPFWWSFDSGELTQVTFSKHPILSTSNFKTPSYCSSWSPSLCLSATNINTLIDYSGINISVFNFHNTAEMSISCQQINYIVKNHMDSSALPIIGAGDFNWWYRFSGAECPPSIVSYEEACYNSCDPSCIFSNGDKRNGVRLNQIYYKNFNDNLFLKDAYVINANEIMNYELSDHRPMIAKFGVNDFSTPICTYFTYSPWSTCNSSALQSRTITSSSPSGCTGGNPENLIQQCLPPCLESNWQPLVSPTPCPSSGQQTKTWDKIGTCNTSIVGSVNHLYPETISCEYIPPQCTDEDWDSNSKQCIDSMCEDKCSAIKGFFLNNTIALEKNTTGLSAGLFILNDTINNCGNNSGCYVCKEGSHEFNGTCVPDSCGGFIPEGTNFTNGSSTFLTGDFKNWTYNLLSRFENKPLGLCEWYCDEGFRLDTSTNNTCIALRESEKLDCLNEAKGFCYNGTGPINSINLTKDASCEDEGDVCFICEKGYKWNGSSCVEDFSVCGEDRCLNPEDKVCYPLKYRLINSTNSRLYCSNDLKFKLQKGEGMNCSVPYECESNYCNSKGKCFDVVEGLVKQVSLLRQIMCFFTSGFSISNEEYNICIFKE